MSERSTGVSRRGFLGLLGAGAVGAVAGAAGVLAADAMEGPASTGSQVVPFHGAHQAGILTPAQDRLHFATFDVTGSRDDLVGLLRTWTDAAALMTQGVAAGQFGAVGGPYDAPPDDTGEALGLSASALTVTFGFGSPLFSDAGGRDRFGLAGQRPDALIDLPLFPADDLDPSRSGGDLCVQACAHDPQVAVHAIRNLARMAFGTAHVRWSQLGFGRTSSTSTSQQTPRNLFGFKDGTNNLKAEDPRTAEQVWAQPGDGPDWIVGGSYLVARRIRMSIETWDRTSLREQESLIGRTKAEGAPLSGGSEFTPPDFAATGGDGQTLIDPDSHVHLANPVNHGGIGMLRRGYNFVDGNDALGRLEAGLFFLAYQRDIRTAFLPVQTALARDDLMNEYVKHVGSATFAVPSGVVARGDFVGQALFG